MFSPKVHIHLLPLNSKGILLSQGKREGFRGVMCRSWAMNPVVYNICLQKTSPWVKGWLPWPGAAEDRDVWKVMCSDGKSKCAVTWGHMKATCESTSLEEFYILPPGILGESRKYHQEGVGDLPVDIRLTKKINGIPIKATADEIPGMEM